MDQRKSNVGSDICSRTYQKFAQLKPYLISEIQLVSKARDKNVWSSKCCVGEGCMWSSQIGIEIALYL